MGNMDIWKQAKKPPLWALKSIGGGRLKGKSNIDPQWRLYMLTEMFGPCGIGWKIITEKLWTEKAEGTKECIACAKVSLSYKWEGKWSEPIEGVGGNKIVTSEKNGLYANDEAYKMAVTDAISVCCKYLGFADNVYRGLFDGSKYNDEDDQGDEYDKNDKGVPNNKLTDESAKESCEYIKDSKGVPRYNKTKDRLNDEEQMKNKLITTTDWRDLQTLIQDFLGGNIQQFYNWLYEIYNVAFYDINKDMLPGIISTVRDRPEEVMNTVPNFLK